MRFREFLALTEQNTVGYHNDVATGSFLGTDWTGSEAPENLEGKGFHLPGLDLVPTVTRSSKIAFIERNKNPIFIMLQDGTRLHFTWDEFNRIQDQPEVGKTMTVVFQRWPGDTTDEQAQIAKVDVR